MIRLVALLLALFGLVGNAAGHGYVVRAIPADRSALERPPTRLQYFFSEALEPRFSEIHLRDQSGTIIASGGVDEGNTALLTLRPPADLPDGAYIVELRPAFASDGHVIAESRVFFVGDEVGGISGRAANDSAIPLEILWRALLSLAQSLFFGCCVCYSVVLLPAWGSGRFADGGLPPRVIRRLRLCLAFSLALAFCGNVIALLQATMVFFNVDAAAVISGGLWQVTQIGTRFGDVWTFRMVLLIFCAALLFTAVYLRESVPQVSSAIMRGMAWLGALFIGTGMITGHAAGALVLPWLAVAVNWIHALAVAAWLGGAAGLALILPVALTPLDAAERENASRIVMLRFSRLAAALLLLVILSGFYNGLNYIFSPSDLATGYGASLGRKLTLGGFLLLIGAGQHLSLRPHLLSRLPRITNRLRWLRIETLIAMLALGTVAWLAATPVPEQNLTRADVSHPQAEQTIGDYSISAAILPGGPGVNTTDALIKIGGDAVTDIQVYAQHVQPERGFRGAWQLMEAVDAGLYAAAGDEIDEAGRWWTLFDIISDAGTARAAFAWDITDAASVQPWREPSPLHSLSLMALVIALIACAAPATRRLIIKLNLSPLSCIVAAIALAAAIAVMAFGAALIAERGREYELTLNPPPERVNPALPDAASLARGEALYIENCLVWQGESADFRALRKRLATVGDDFLYRATGEGWRDLPGCGEMSDGERWDVVNYFRTFEGRVYPPSVPP